MATSFVRESMCIMVSLTKLFQCHRGRKRPQQSHRQYDMCTVGIQWVRSDNECTATRDTTTERAKFSGCSTLLSQSEWFPFTDKRNLFRNNTKLIISEIDREKWGQRGMRKGYSLSISAQRLYLEQPEPRHTLSGTPLPTPYPKQMYTCGETSGNQIDNGPDNGSKV